MPTPDPAAAYQRIAAIYARAVDRGDVDALDMIMTPDAVVEGPGFRLEGRETLHAIPAMLRDAYVMTRHVVHNQTLVNDGDGFSGETYCTAHHIRAPEAENGTHTAWVWAVRYQDRLAEHEEQWRLSHRRLIVDWSHEQTVDLTLSAPIQN
ncbi:MAG: nuclear transport factor 2 family protein [Novosphingobium sp.]